MANGESIEVS